MKLRVQEVANNISDLKKNVTPYVIYTYIGAQIRFMTYTVIGNCLIWYPSQHHKRPKDS